MSNLQSSPDEWLPPFCVALYDTKHDGPITEDQLTGALNCNYNMLTSSITTAYFRKKIEALVAEHSSGGPIQIVPSLTYRDTHLEPSSITSSLLARTSSWIDVCSPDPITAGISRQVLLMEVAFAAFCGFDQIVIQGPKLYHHDSLRGEDVATNNITQFARAIEACLSAGPRIQISILLPPIDGSESSTVSSLQLPTRDEFIDPQLDPVVASTDGLTTWDAWNTIRTTCKYHSRLNVALEMPVHLPSTHVQSRWFSEPVKLLFLDKGTFTSSTKGYPILTPSVRAFLKDMMRLRVAPWIVLADVDSMAVLKRSGEIPHADGDLPDDMVVSINHHTAASVQSQDLGNDDLAYLNYIRYFENKQEPCSRLERDTAGYQDYLQIPLQPLTDNLESMTYEVFEKDPVKYDLYEEALRKALRHFHDNRKSTSGPVGQIVVVVAGAGRGPLVTRALRASQAENIMIDLWAIEKNPNAFVLLQRANREKWKDRVRLEQSDMRSWKGPWMNSYSPEPVDAFTPVDPSEVIISKAHYSVDILVSELLGSFGDNELSPECLDGISHLVAKPDGISIPRSYTAWLTPISSPRLHADISQRYSYDTTAAETPAVVWLNQIDYLSCDLDSMAPQQGSTKDSKTNLNHQAPRRTKSSPNVLCAWEFKHAQGQADSKSTHLNGASQGSGASSDNTHNLRFAKLSFRTRHRGVCHGLGGYFEAVLFPGVELSTNPNTIDDKSKDMISWFPMFFPLKTPLYIPGISTLDVSMWRQTDGRRVWYEWMVESWGWNVASNSSGSGRKRDGDVNGSKKHDDNEERRYADRRMVKLGTTELHSSIKNACLM